MIYTDSAPTLEEVWQIVRETEQIIKELLLQSKETDHEFEETKQILKELALQSKETDRKFQETDRKFQETERLMDKRSKEIDKKIGKLGGRIGDFVEGVIAPGIEQLFQERGIEVTSTSRRVKKKNKSIGLEMEIDLLVTNGDCCVLVEVKSSLSVDDVKEHLERMKKFKPLFPEHKDKKIYGAVAGMVIEEGADKYAWRKGFFVIAQKGDLAIILNDYKFKPHIW